MSFEPLKGLRVLDLTSVVVGPVATVRLAQYGAEVIKVESPAGDLMRGLGGLSPSGQHSGAYLHLNRGKRNICLDLKTAEAKTAIQRLVDSSSIIVANMRPEALTRLGLDPTSIRKKNPNTIYCLLTGFGTDGPYSGLPAYDSVIQGASGIAGLGLARDGAPSYVPMLICDHVVGEIAAGAILAAVLERQRTGTGTLLELPMFETMAAFVLQEHLAQQSFRPAVGPAGDRRLLDPNNKPVATRDGYVSLTVNTDEQVRNFLHATDRTHIAEDPRFNSVSARAKNVVAWFEIRGAALTERTTSEWLTIFRRADIAAMPCHTLDSLASDPHLEAVAMLSPQQHPTEGQTIAIRPSLRVNNANAAAGSYAAPKGRDTIAVLRDVGYTDHEIEKLISSGAAFAISPGIR